MAVPLGSRYFCISCSTSWCASCFRLLHAEVIGVCYDAWIVCCCYCLVFSRLLLLSNSHFQLLDNGLFPFFFLVVYSGPCECYTHSPPLSNPLQKVSALSLSECSHTCQDPDSRALPQFPNWLVKYKHRSGESPWFAFLISSLNF